LIVLEYKETMMLQAAEIEKLKEELAATIQDKEKLSYKLKELQLNHNQLQKDIKKLEKSKENVWIAGSIVAALVIWLMGFLAGHFRILTENKRLHQMTLSAK
jgi:lipid II:glycine glycyltransferase (peptidoglycan interpeptide bridge formation enzyme)